MRREKGGEEGRKGKEKRRGGDRRRVRNARGGEERGEEEMR